MPEGWKKGWSANSQTVKTAPRWTLTLAGRHRSLTPSVVAKTDTFNLTAGGGFRSTWFQQHVLTQRNPGPGRYRTDFELPSSAKDSVDVNKSVKESAPKFSVPKHIKETTLSAIKLSILKPSYLNVPKGKSTDVQPAPGPGQYTQYTFFGAASGPTRKQYF